MGKNSAKMKRFSCFFEQFSLNLVNTTLPHPQLQWSFPMSQFSSMSTVMMLRLQKNEFFDELISFYEQQSNYKKSLSTIGQFRERVFVFDESWIQRPVLVSRNQVPSMCKSRNNSSHNSIDVGPVIVSSENLVQLWTMRSPTLSKRSFTSELLTLYYPL